jgi:hypothetical protein
MIRFCGKRDEYPISKIKGEKIRSNEHIDCSELVSGDRISQQFPYINKDYVESAVSAIRNTLHKQEGMTTEPYLISR